MDALVLAREAVASEADMPEGLALVRDLSVTTDDEQFFAADVLRDVKGKHHALDERRKTITVPINTALKEVNALFRPVLTTLEEMERLLKTKIAGYLQQKEAANRAAFAAAAAAPSSAAATAALAAVTDVQPPTGVSVRYAWKFEVIDPTAVPAVFCSPDPAKIGEAARVAVDAGIEPEVPGVRFFKEPVVSARRVL